MQGIDSSSVRGGGMRLHRRGFVAERDTARHLGRDHGPGRDADDPIGS